MTHLFIAVILFISLNTAFARAYEVKKDDSEIRFGMDVSDNKEQRTSCINTSAFLKFVSFTLPTIAPGAEIKRFSLYGLSFSKKNNNSILSRSGYLEYGFDFGRTVSSKDEEKVNMLNINLIQNFNFFRTYSNRILGSVGAGGSGIYLANEEAKQIRSSNNLGVSLLLKMDLIFLLNQLLIADVTLQSIDFSMSEDLGRVDKQNINISSLKLGVNFDW